MDMNEKDNCGTEKTEDHLNYRNSSMSSDWQFSNPFHTMPMVNSFSHSLWNLQATTGTPALGLTESSSIPAPGGWNPPGPVPSTGASFLQASSLGILPPNLPTDSAFIERAARFSMFNSQDSMESEFSAHQDAAQLTGETGDSSSKDLGAKRIKRTNEDLQPSSNEAKIGNAETSKDVKEDTEEPKPDYIHFRARRGQATNSHSLAERLRREKISERMKLLQDLVPGCSKVTGKAVMLDEIINYVQSLQRQVEFLSMKLATVSPSLDSNIEALLSKEIFQNNCGPSSAIDFVPDIVHPQLHMQQQGLLPSGISVALNASDSLRRAINAQLTAMNGYKEPVHNAWNEEIQNTLQMNYGGNPNLHMQEFNKP